MQQKLLEILRCPVTRSKLKLQVIKDVPRQFGDTMITTVEEGILFADEHWFYPIVKGIPRLCAESFLDHVDFLKTNMKDYEGRKTNLQSRYSDVLQYVLKKNKRTKDSFNKEWSVYNYEKDKTWNAGDEEMLNRFLTETGESMESIKSKAIFDAGCGNGKLNCLLAEKGIFNIAMDLSTSIEFPASKTNSANVHFIQGDVQFPPVAFNYFDIVHSSGVLIHTNNTELSFSCLVPALKNGGKLSVWLYHPRNNFLHRLFNSVRTVTSELPLGLQYYLYLVTIFPLGYCIKKLKGNPQNAREMMVDILDWFTPEFRWEHGHEEAASWFYKRQFKKVKVTTDGVFGFNIIGEKEY
ncbi:MAG: methyltransferase domain-containing protein [Ferruginibacter sp.]